MDKTLQMVAGHEKVFEIFGEIPPVIPSDFDLLNLRMWNVESVFFHLVSLYNTSFWSLPFARFPKSHK